jgi:hypothetical protein
LKATLLKKFALIILTIALPALPSCTPIGGLGTADATKMAQIKLVTARGGNLKGSMAIAVREIDGKKVGKKVAGSRIAFLTPGEHTLTCELAKLDHVNPQVMVCSLKPILVSGNFKAGETYWVDFGTLDLPPSNLGSNTLAQIGNHNATTYDDHIGSPRLVAGVK